jgi:hypothetical protein
MLRMGFVVAPAVLLFSLFGCSAGGATGVAGSAERDAKGATLLESNVGDPWISPDGRSVAYQLPDLHVVWRDLASGARQAVSGQLVAVRPEGVVYETPSPSGGPALGYFDWQGRPVGGLVAAPADLDRDHASVARLGVASSGLVLGVCAGDAFEIRRPDGVVHTAAIAGLPDGGCALQMSPRGAYAAAIVTDASGVQRIVSAKAEDGATAVTSEPVPGASWVESGAIGDGALFESDGGLLSYVSFETGAITRLSSAPVPSEKIAIEGDSVVFLQGPPHGTGDWSLALAHLSPGGGPVTTLATGTGRVANGGNYRELSSATSRWVGTDLVATDLHVSILPHFALFDVVTTTYVVPLAGGAPRALCDSCIIGLNGTDMVVQGKFAPGQTIEDLASGTQTFVPAADPPGQLTSLFLTPDDLRVFRYWTTPENADSSTVYDYDLDWSSPGESTFTSSIAMSFDMTKARGDATIATVLGSKAIFRSPYGDLFRIE